MSKPIPSSLTHHIRDLAALWQEDSRDDTELLTVFAHTGDQAAFTILVGRHGATVWAVCRSLLANAAEAEDAFQATFLTLARCCRRVDVRSLEAWLTTVAQNAARDILRADRRRTVAHERLVERERVRNRFAESATDEELAKALQEELAALPMGLRVPLVLYYLEGKTQPEIGRILGMPKQTVSFRIRKGLGVLRKHLSNRGMVVSVAVIMAALNGAAAAQAAPSALLLVTTIRAAATATPAAIAPTRPTRLVLPSFVKSLLIGLGVAGVMFFAGLWAVRMVENTEVHGRVSVGHEPLARAEVVLVPDHGEPKHLQVVRAYTDQEGRFRIPAGSGRYRALVVGDRVPGVYCSAVQTPLRVDVGAMPVAFDIPIAPFTRSEPMWPPSHKSPMDVRTSWGILSGDDARND